MCGIAGALSAAPDVPAPLDAVERFAAAMVHRGPDGYGFHTDGPVALGHRRLAIVDLSEGGRQPMLNEDGSVAIVVNGEIYNHQELRADLIAKGHRFRGGSDSEVVAHLYEEVGARTPEMLRGMFALAVWDRRTRRLLLARDRVGEKPLYYAQRADGLVFASELAALLADPRTPATLSYESLDAYLALQYVPSPATIFQEIHKLPAGHLIDVGCGETPTPRRYYQASFAPTLAESADRRGAPPRARHGRRGGAVAADVGRAAGRVPFGRHRFVDRRGLHGPREQPAGEDVLGRLHRGRRGPRGAAVRAPRRRTLPDRPPRAGRRPGHGRRAAQHRSPSRRAVRRHVRRADPVPVRADPAARDGGAVRRRRRRDLRRVPPLQLGACRRSDRPLAGDSAGAGDGADGARARRHGPVAARVRSHRPGRGGRALLALRLSLFARREGGALHARAARALRDGRDGGALRRAAGGQRRRRHRDPPDRAGRRHVPAGRHPDQGRHRQHDLVAGGARAVLRSPRGRAGRGAARPLEAAAQQGQAHPERGVRRPGSRSPS